MNILDTLKKLAGRFRRKRRSRDRDQELLKREQLRNEKSRARSTARKIRLGKPVPLSGLATTPIPDEPRGPDAAKPVLPGEIAAQINKQAWPGLPANQVQAAKPAAPEAAAQQPRNRPLPNPPEGVRTTPGELPLPEDAGFPVRKMPELPAVLGGGESLPGPASVAAAGSQSLPGAAGTAGSPRPLPPMPEPGIGASRVPEAASGPPASSGGMPEAVSSTIRTPQELPATDFLDRSPAGSGLPITDLFDRRGRGPDLIQELPLSPDRRSRSSGQIQELPLSPLARPGGFEPGNGKSGQDPAVALLRELVSKAGDQIEATNRMASALEDLPNKLKSLLGYG